jgi:hypothetical protein
VLNTRLIFRPLPGLRPDRAAPLTVSVMLIPLSPDVDNSVWVLLYL